MSGRANTISASRFAAALLGCTVLAGLPASVLAQDAQPAAQPTPTPAPAPAEQGQVIRSIAVAGAQRLEPATIVSYIQMRPGQMPFDEVHRRPALVHSVDVFFRQQFFMRQVPQDEPLSAAQLDQARLRRQDLAQVGHGKLVPRRPACLLLAVEFVIPCSFIRLHRAAL